MDRQSDILPYRIDADDLYRFVQARARGRSTPQIRTLGFAPKTFEGVLSSVESLALVSNKDGELTGLGRRYAVASAEEKVVVLRDMIRGFSPFSLLLDAVLAGNGPRPTPLEWIETWWATHGFGSSESNRAEAAPVFAKLVEAAGLGSYIPGRRGHASRIEWADDARTLVHHPRSLLDDRPSADPTAEDVDGVPSPGLALATTPGARGASTGGAITANAITWQLSPGRLVELRVPADISAAEKVKLLGLFELLLRD